MTARKTIQLEVADADDRKLTGKMNHRNAMTKAKNTEPERFSMRRIKAAGIAQTARIQRKYQTFRIQSNIGSPGHCTSSSPAAVLTNVTRKQNEA